MLEADHLAALRVDARHDVLDGAVLARRIHGLEDQQERPAVVGVEEVLLGAQRRRVSADALLVVLFGLVKRLDVSRPLREGDRLPRPHPKVFRADVHPDETRALLFSPLVAGPAAGIRLSKGAEPIAA